MNKIDNSILQVNSAICNNIEKFDVSERGLLSVNIIAQLRNLVESVSLKALFGEQDADVSYSNITKANAYVSTKANLKFLSKFHNFLQITASHYTLDEEKSERLMLKYYEYLIKIKSFLKNTYNLDILENIDQFPIKTDSTLTEYYTRITEKINSPQTSRLTSTYNERYYIQKIKPFFVKYEVYYEVTFTTANDNTSKFDRIIAFTKLDILPNYAVKLTISNDNIKVLDKVMPIQFIDDWEVSIRTCELNNFAKIFNSYSKINGGSFEYRELMSYLKKHSINLLEIIRFPDDLYLQFKEIITKNGKTYNFLKILDTCRVIIRSYNPGTNVISYLLYRLNNRIIKIQYSSKSSPFLSDLYLKFGCIPFDEMPFATSLIEHNPKLTDLFECIEFTGREHELLARKIKNNAEFQGQLYTPASSIVGFQNITLLMDAYNKKLYKKHKHRMLENYKEHIYIKEYEEETFYIIEKLKTLTSKGIKNYTNSFDSWQLSTSYSIDCPEKMDKLRLLFEHSEVALIYGSAGTGKSTFINHISARFNDRSKLFLANTNPAVNNLKRRVTAGNCTFKTIASFLANKNVSEFNLLIIDECSTVSNSDMVEILKKASFKLLVLVGDVYQIESIQFGNWFSMARSFVPQTSVFELTKPYRSRNAELLNLWTKVRNMDDDILEHITKKDFSITLNQSIFDHSEKDEIILCLNYDGLYGINNINRFLQGNNVSDPVQWGVQIYKINDPILFNESKRFAPLIYNNLKGKIVNVEIIDDRIQFDIGLDRAIDEFEAEGYDFELMDITINGNSVIRFSVNRLMSTDEDDDSSSNAVVPFQIAYAISIHKAQGLEYNSVKIIITDEIEEMITHNIFYTAITRAKEKLKIYWSPETEKNVLSSLNKRTTGKDVALLLSKVDLKIADVI